MSENTGRFSKRSNENLLQLWRARDVLNDEDIDPLRDELKRRGLSGQMAQIEDEIPTRDMYGPLPPSPQTYLNLSLPVWWIRELWLRYKTRNGISVQGTVEKVQRTRAGMHGAARVELDYSYDFQGQHYSGRVIRDFSFDSAQADSLAYDHHPGEKLPIRINRDAPQLSYYPSGLGFVDPLLSGFGALFAWAVVIGVVRVVLLAALHTH